MSVRRGADTREAGNCAPFVRVAITGRTLECKTVFYINLNMCALVPPNSLRSLPIKDIFISYRGSPHEATPLAHLSQQGRVLIHFKNPFPLAYFISSFI